MFCSQKVKWLRSFFPSVPPPAAPVMANPWPLTRLRLRSVSLNPVPQVLLLLGPDRSHLDAGEVSFGAHRRRSGGETSGSPSGLFLSWGHVETAGPPPWLLGRPQGGSGPARAALAASPTQSFSLGAACCFQFLTVCSLFSPDPPQSSTL